MLITLIVLFPPLALAVWMFVLYRRRGAELESLEKNLDDAYAYKRKCCQELEDKIAELEQTLKQRTFVYVQELRRTEQEHSKRIDYLTCGKTLTTELCKQCNCAYSISKGMSLGPRESINGQTDNRKTKLTKPKNVRTTRTSLPDSGRKPRTKLKTKKK